MAIGRQFWVIVHRWAGLTIALFLAVAGFTGIFLAWYDEIEIATAPELRLAAPPYEDAPLLDPLRLRQKVMDDHPGSVINSAPLRLEAGRAVIYELSRHDPGTGALAEYSHEWDQIFVNPYTGKVHGTRLWGDIGEGRVNIMPFLYRLHYQLALGEWGVLAFGIAALIWTFDSFVGFYLTFPIRIWRNAGGTRAGGPRWWERWKPAWSVRWGSSAYKVNFDLHRAGGLWIWPMLLVFAWSSVAFNLPQVYTPAMSAFGAQDMRAGMKPLPQPRHEPKITFAAAAMHGRELAAEVAKRRGLVMHGGALESLMHMPAAGLYIYRFTTSADITGKGGWSRLAFDSDTGVLKGIELPTGQNGANSFTNWIMALHMGMVFGLPYRIAVSLIGAMVTMLSITGVVIWMKKRSGRAGRRLRLAGRDRALAPAE